MPTQATGYLPSEHNPTPKLLWIMSCATAHLNSEAVLQGLASGLIAWEGVTLALNLTLNGSHISTRQCNQDHLKESNWIPAQQEGRYKYQHQARQTGPPGGVIATTQQEGKEKAPQSGPEPALNAADLATLCCPC
jgi:hypothetical protein